ncbi:oligosaccharide repeat unit polymerase [Chryseobacterium aahli]|nr:oligosaccharide repeat unit polymerase [Chryseobacterium aahli]
MAWILVIIQLLSAGGVFFMGKDLNMENLTDYAYVLLSCVLLFLIISPWKNYYGVQEFVVPNSQKLKNFTNFLIIVNSIAFVILSIITYIVQSTVVDINKFKYSEGVGADFIASHLPFPNVFFSLAIMLSYFGYFILPLHFYYLYKKRFLLSLVCFILSLNIMLVGLTYFSRAAVLQYVFIYLFMLYLHYNIYNKFIKRNIKIGMIITSVVAVMYFINVSVLRFQEDTSLAKSYSKTIPVDAVTQDPLTYSFLDYMSQGYLNGFEVLKIYKGEGFNGTLTFEKVIGLISNDSNATYNRLKYRQKLWPREYSYSFNGFPAYAVYDYGILGSILVCLLYFFLINKLKPRNDMLDLRNVFIIVVLIQIPLMSIFYSEIGGSIIAILLCIPVWIYFKFNIKNA